MNWKTLKVGETIFWNISEFDSMHPRSIAYEVTDIDDERALVRKGSVKNWVDDDTEPYFSRIPKYRVSEM